MFILMALAKLFSLIQVLITLMTISICTVFLTIIIPVHHDVYSQQQQRQQLPINAIFHMVANSTVGIITENNDGSNLEFDGTGFVYETRGDISYIVTNAHVIQDVQDDEPVKVIFIDGRIHMAEIKGIDRQGDIAVLTIKKNVTSEQQLPAPLVIGDSSELQVGEQVIAIGNPFIEDQSFADLLTTGVISKLGVEASYGDVETESSILNAIVTDAATAGGSSGGPLLNLRGEVVGMNAAGDDNTPCCSYAIPSNTIKHIVPTLIKTGKFIHPWIGLEPLTLNVDPQSGESIPSNLQGVIVSYIDRDGPAHKAKIKGSTINQFDEIEIGDIITAIDGEPVATADEFNAYIDEHKVVGDKVVLSIYRNNGQTLNLGVTLEENPYYSSNTE
jgi:S1-C subfamily serine protease